MTRPHLLMIGGWTEAIQKAVDSGFEVTYFGRWQASRGLEPHVLTRCRQTCEVDIEQVGICLALAKQIHAEHPLAAVVSFSELGVESAAIIAGALGIKGLDLWPVSVTRYKNWMRRILVNFPELAVPWRQITSGEDLERFYDKHGPHVVVRPVVGSGGADVRRISSRADLDTVLVEVNWHGGQRYLAEQHINGDALYGVESLTMDGEHAVITFSYAKLVGYPYAIRGYVMVPPPPPFELVRDDIVKVATSFLSAIDLRWGAAHTEVKVAADGRPVIIDSHTGVGGNRVWRLLEITTGVQQIDAVLRGLADGDVVVPYLPPTSSVGVFFSILPPAGQVRGIADIENLKGLRGLLDLEIDIEPGHELQPITEDSQRRGYVLFHADSHEDAYAIMRDIGDRFWVEYDDGTVWRPEF